MPRSRFPRIARAAHVLALGLAIAACAHAPTSTSIKEDPMSTAARQAVGYAEIIEHLEGRTDLAQAVEAIKINTRQLAKAQRTWLRRFRQIEWMDLTPASTVHAVADQLIARVSPESPFR